jgi:hypothetical protein
LPHGNELIRSAVRTNFSRADLSYSIFTQPITDVLCVAFGSDAKPIATSDLRVKFLSGKPKTDSKLQLFAKSHWRQCRWRLV